MENVILVIVLAAILGAAIWYVIRAKKKGQKCIGCPSGCSCHTDSGSACGGNCGGCNGGCENH